MLVNCPKCGFSQPKDKYCAACGIDMESFKPKQDPFLKRFLDNIWVQITGLVVLVVSAYVFIKADRIGHYLGLGSTHSGVGFFFVTEKDSKNANTKSSFKSGSENADETGDLAENANSNTEEPNFIEATTTTINNLLGLNPEKNSADNVANSDGRTESSAELEMDKKGLNKNLPPLWIGDSKIPNNSKAIQIDLLELSTEDFNKIWVASSRIRQSHKMDKILVAITSTEKIKDLKPIQRFHSILRMNDPRIQKDYFITNNNSANLPSGLSVDFNYAFDDFQPRVTVNGLIEEHLKEFVTEHPMTVETDNKEAVLISGILSPNAAKNIYLNEDEMANMNIPAQHPFLIFKSKTYQNGQSQFTILLQFSKN